MAGGAQSRCCKLGASAQPETRSCAVSDSLPRAWRLTALRGLPYTKVTVPRLSREVIPSTRCFVCRCAAFYYFSLSLSLLFLLDSCAIWSGFLLLIEPWLLCSIYNSAGRGFILCARLLSTPHDNAILSGAFTSHLFVGLNSILQPRSLLTFALPPHYSRRFTKSTTLKNGFYLQISLPLGARWLLLVYSCSF
jgi:hypothetical protein